LRIKIDAKSKIFCCLIPPQLLNAWEPWRMKGAQRAMGAIKLASEVARIFFSIFGEKRVDI
jgi:hypothetical protein